MFDPENSIAIGDTVFNGTLIFAVGMRGYGYAELLPDGSIASGRRTFNLWLRTEFVSLKCVW